MNTSQPATGQEPFRELGTTSAPLKSAAFFIGAACKDYNDDFMLCKNESRDPEHCLKEGRRVTRCAQNLINNMLDSCSIAFFNHFECLLKNNDEYYPCRKQEHVLNRCMLTKYGLTKTIPGSPAGQPQIHELQNPIYGAIQR